MTDKEIIIDGINISECEFLINNKDKQICHCLKSDLFGMVEFVENAKNKNCNENSNCYYKQLKRKEKLINEIEECCRQCNLKWDFTACDILNIIDKII